MNTKVAKKHNCLFMFFIVVLLIGIFIGKQLLSSIMPDKCITYSILLLITLIFFITSIFRKDTFPLMLLLFSTKAFMCACINKYSIYALYIFIGLISLSMIIHFIKFKPKFRLGSFFIPLSLLLIIYAISGLGVNGFSMDTLMKIVNIAFALFSYIFFISTIEKPTMDEVTFSICSFTLIYGSFIFLPNLIWQVVDMEFHGFVANNYFLQVLLIIAIPFTLYSNINVDSFKKVVKAIFSLLVLIAITIMTIHYDPMVLICELISIILMLILGLAISEKKLSTAIFFIITIYIFAMTVFIYTGGYDYSLAIASIKEYWHDVLSLQDKVKELVDSGLTLLGKGYALSNSCLISGILESMGIIGLIAYFIYAFFKYIILIRAKTVGSLIGAISFIASGIILLTSFVFTFTIYLAFVLFMLLSLEYQSNEELLCEYGE